MKKLFMMLLILFIIYIGIQLGFRIFGNGHEYDYVITSGEYEFKIREKYTNNTQDEMNSYYFEIGVDDQLFSYQTYQSFDKSSHVIKDIKYYKDEYYKCILPIFLGDKIISDIMCLKDGVIYHYFNIKGDNNNLDQFVSSLKEIGYNESKLDNNVGDNVSSNKDNIAFYSDNIIKKHFLSLTNYKGIYTINDTNSYNLKKIELFNNDVYKRPLSIVFNQFYVVADYNQQYRFDKFLVVDITTNKTTEINCERQISFDSYIQGTNKNSIYIFDRDNKKQYEINVKTNKVLEVGNETTNIKVYKNNTWEKVTAMNAKNNIILFDNEYKNDIKLDGFVKIDKVGGNLTGYYYFYKQEESQYLVYRAPVSNSNQLTYLFNVTDINRINYYKDYVYYIYNDEVRYFNEQLGVKTLIVDKELSFNDNVTFGLYVK